jgi:hypothetical protein
MLLGIDHLVIAVPDPDDAAAALESTVGLRATGGGRHETLGTFNRLVWLGDTYLELIGVWDRARAETSWVGAPTVHALDRGGGLATWALASDDLDAEVGHLRDQGAELQGPMSGERRRTDDRVVRWRLAAPAQLGPEGPPFWIEHDPTAAEWSADERMERAAQVHPLGGPCRLEVLELPVIDQRAVAARSMALLRSTGLRFRPSLAGAGARDADVGPEQRVRLLPAGSLARPTVRLRAPVEQPRDLEALGLRWVVRSSPI